MKRRYSSLTVGFILGAMVTGLGLYLSQSHASEGPSKTRTLVDRIAALESRVQALEQSSGTFLVPGFNGSLVLPDGQWNDGFGPVKTIPIDSSKQPK